MAESTRMVLGLGLGILVMIILVAKTKVHISKRFYVISNTLQR